MARIPELPSLPFVGNVTDIDPSLTHVSYSRLADIHGEVFGFYMASEHTIVVNSHDVWNDCCDEKKFEKIPAGAAVETRHLLGDGLFTAYSGEPNWAIAHRILMPKFGPIAIKNMFEEMHDIACQLVSKWARQGPEQVIDPTSDFTRLTLDSIAMCAMDTRFNSFYREDAHPFAKAMAEFLTESGRRAFRPQILNDYVYRGANRKFTENIEIMRAVAQQAIKERRDHPSSKNDVLNAMLLGKDPKTGKGMTEDSITQNAITFLIAGHETTSGMLSFLFVSLLSNPRALQIAQREVDTVVGKGPITMNHMSKLPYLTACLRETLRLWPTAPGSRVKAVPRKDEDYSIHVGKKGYPINKHDVLQQNLLKIHRDPLVYGPDAEEFRPERMLDENFEKLPPNAWKPFGNGMRSCIGRSFAWQEGHIAVAMILQNFNLRAEDPSYVMKLKQTLTIKPAGFGMRASLREGITPTSLEKRLWGGKQPQEDVAKDRRVEEVSKVKQSPITILYGSNAGTCEALATSLASTASSRGDHPKVMPLDSATGLVPTDQPVIIIASSYEGEPPDNARQFVQWLQGLENKDLQGVRYAVFGCGNHDWTSTFHKIPNFIDKIFESKAATRIAPKGLSDVASNNVFDNFDQWLDNDLRPGLEKKFAKDLTELPQHQELEIHFHKTSRSNDLRQDLDEAIVQNVKRLTLPGEPEKRHLELRLPGHMAYAAGDYLAVLPVNPTGLVKEIMARFGLAWDTVLEIKVGQYTALPQGRSITAMTILSAYVELNEVITQKQLSTLAACTSDPLTRSALSDLTADRVAEQRVSIVFLLSKYPDIALPFGSFLAMLPPLRLRQYSISSSPLRSPHTCTLTYSVLKTTAKSDPGKRYLGTASTYLSELKPGDHIQVGVRPSHVSFHLPLDIGNVPIIMICAGTGIAPFRAFVQQRAEQIDGGRTLAPALLFVGCRHSAKDALYLDEFMEWAKMGAVDVRYAYSHEEAASEGCKHVQHRLWKDREDMSKLWAKGAKLFVCGNSAMANDVGRVLVDVWMEDRDGSVDQKEGEAWLKDIRNERFASDVFDWDDSDGSRCMDP